MKQTKDRLVLTEEEQMAFEQVVREGVFRQLRRDGWLTAGQLEALLKQAEGPRP
ncbi:MAG: hypothetical protein LKK00_07730 [Intestinimonas sp.]|jgi:hypothetical protein|nr:hypothetical protein [Intestinimonas sp.]